MRSIHSAKAALATALLLATSGCFLGRASDNEPLRMDSIQGFEPGKTTARQVVERLGAPVDVVQLGKRSAYLYSYTHQKAAGLLLLVVGLFGEDARQDRVWLFFDEDNVLTHAGGTFQSHHATYSLPWGSRFDADSMRADDDARRATENSSGS